MFAFMLQQHHSVVVTETTKPKLFLYIQGPVEKSQLLEGGPKRGSDETER